MRSDERWETLQGGEPIGIGAAKIGAAFTEAGFEVKYIYGGCPVVRHPATLVDKGRLLAIAIELGLRLALFDECVVLEPPATDDELGDEVPS